MSARVQREAFDLGAELAGFGRGAGAAALAMPATQHGFHSRGRFVKVLKLSAQGLPQSWISLQQAVIHYAAEEVRWEAGGLIAVFHGGYNAVTGAQ